METRKLCCLSYESLGSDILTESESSEESDTMRHDDEREYGSDYETREYECKI